jgi:hypothetical protein
MGRGGQGGRLECLSPPNFKAQRRLWFSAILGVLTFNTVFLSSFHANIYIHHYITTHDAPKIFPQ